jgi:Rhodopirellula transposase DDE domain
MIVVALVKEKYNRLSSMMDEKLKRHWAACEALASGRGGISAVSEATGMSRHTIRRGIREVQQEMPRLAGEFESRVRRPGGGRKPLSTIDPTLQEDLKALVESTTRGDPMSPLLWTCKSTRKLAEELQKRGHQVSHTTVDCLLRSMDYSLQSNRKTQEGKQHPDRNAQFEFIARVVRRFQRHGQPVISVDGKKKESLGNLKNSGREWRQRGHPEEVAVHDFRNKQLGIAIPFGLYDPTRNEGWVDVGVDHDTAEFAVATVRRWWRRMGCRVYPHATELLITADAGGSNGYRVRLWKYCLQKLADDSGLQISVCHFPPGTSKWNKIEHSMFCHITENWRGRPLISRAVVVNLIGNTRTHEGLHIHAELDAGHYARGIKVSDEEYATIRLKTNTFHGDWNYTILPHR